MAVKPPFFAEIVETALSNWLAQSWQWEQVPTYGSLLIAEAPNCDYYGLVFTIQTGALEAFRIPVAYQKTVAELQREQPQIFEFLKSNSRVLSLGYRLKDGPLMLITPAQPPPIHAFIRFATSAEIKNFSSNYDFLYLLFSQVAQLNCDLDELLLAFFRWLHEQSVLPDLREFGELYGFLIGRDYQRLRRFLHRLESLLWAQDRQKSDLSLQLKTDN